VVRINQATPPVAKSLPAVCTITGGDFSGALPCQVLDAQLLRPEKRPFAVEMAVSGVAGSIDAGMSGAGGDPGDCRDQLRGVGGVADLGVVIKDDPVGVVDDLGFVTELRRACPGVLCGSGGRRHRAR